MLLILHIAGSFIFIGTGTVAMITKNEVYKKIMRGFVVFEFATGTLLSISSGASFGSYCAKMGVYLAFWLVLELVFILRSQNQKLTQEKGMEQIHN